MQKTRWNLCTSARTGSWSSITSLRNFRTLYKTNNCSFQTIEYLQGDQRRYVPAGADLFEKYWSGIALDTLLSMWFDTKQSRFVPRVWWSIKMHTLFHNLRTSIVENLTSSDLQQVCRFDDAPFLREGQIIYFNVTHSFDKQCSRQKKC